MGNLLHDFEVILSAVVFTKCRSLKGRYVYVQALV